MDLIQGLLKHISMASQFNHTLAESMHQQSEQLITDTEISQIESEQNLTDIEIQLAEVQLA